MASDFSVGVILPASGTGERMGLSPPKQFSEMFGKPIFFYSIYCFHRFDWVKTIMLTVSKDYIDGVRKLVADYNLNKVTVIEGGMTRHRSIFKGIQAFSARSPPDVLIIHDAVRLFVTNELARNVVLSAKKHGAAGVMRPLVSTVIAIESNFLEESLDRNRYWASEMPQAFQFDVIKRAYEQSTDYDFDYGTECLLLATKYTGVKAHILEGSDDLWKVTYIKDLYAAEGMLKAHYIQVQLFGTESSHLLVLHLEKHLKSRRIQVSSATGNNVVTPSGNTFVFLHRKISKDIGQQTDMVVKSLKCKNHIPVLNCVVIHVFTGVDKSTCDVSKLNTYLSGLSNTYQQQNVSIYSLLAYKDSRLDEISPLVTELIWERKSVFSGQLYIVGS
ncbi:D-ribitol-5-phosphate cytidylyltransferase-like [Gigantopelta aegis]|uniref:D-ribitol-5-phosphate cytidylyltransferase-like n=1 Tax=Gigantopelta aegis TaxID=1735272 RepID=UPI001B888503|nr:D-ribitol-5-phosphate cytidylyltransferase-like [Gigantopelta aegis]